MSVKRLECYSKSIFRILDKILWPYLRRGRLFLTEIIETDHYAEAPFYLLNFFFYIAVRKGRLGLL